MSERFPAAGHLVKKSYLKMLHIMKISRCAALKVKNPIRRRLIYFLGIGGGDLEENGCFPQVKRVAVFYPLRERLMY